MIKISIITNFLKVTFRDFTTSSLSNSITLNQEDCKILLTATNKNEIEVNGKITLTTVEDILTYAHLIKSSQLANDLYCLGVPLDDIILLMPTNLIEIELISSKE